MQESLNPYWYKQTNEKEKPFFTVKCQHTNVEGIRELENYHLATIVVIIASGRISVDIKTSG